MLKLRKLLKTMDISCYSFTSVCKYASKIMTNGGNILTLSYYGAEKVMPHYNVMGIAKSALETSVKYIATDLGKKYKSKRNFCWTNKNFSFFWYF